MSTYSFGIPGWFIWALHIAIGIFLFYVGYKMLDGSSPGKPWAVTIIILGVLAAVYHLHLAINNTYLSK